MPNLLVAPLIRNFLSSTAKELNDIRAKQTGTVSSGDFTSRSGSFASPSTPSNLSDALKSSIALTSPDPYLHAVGEAGSAKAVSNLASSILSSGDTVAGAVTYPSDSGTSVAVPNYLNADLAKAYGMDAATAYQEALSNTSYQRAVSDLKAAGLNPALLTGNFGPASSSVYGAALASDGLSTGVSSAAGAHDWYKKLSNIGGLIGAGAAALSGSGVRGASFGYQLGSAAGGAIGNLFDLNR